MQKHLLFSIILVMLSELIPTPDQLKAGIDAFYKKESRAQLYFNAISHLNQYWGSFDEMAAGIKILLDSWHKYFYSFGKFDLSSLSACIFNNIKNIEAFKDRNIQSFCETDEGGIFHLFKEFLEALKGGKNQDVRSAVAVAKTIHLLAPHFFPLWDNPIAYAYGTLWGMPYSAMSEYILFMQKIQGVLINISEYEFFAKPIPARSALKILDEYNYSKFTKHWI